VTFHFSQEEQDAIGQMGSGPTTADMVEAHQKRVEALLQRCARDGAALATAIERLARSGALGPPDEVLRQMDLIRQAVEEQEAADESENEHVRRLPKP